MLIVKNIHKSFGEQKVLNGLSFELERGKTKLWLAAELKENRTTVSKWCTNDIQPTMETLYRIANTLKVDVRELLVPNSNIAKND